MSNMSAILIAGSIFVVLFAAIEIGYRLGRRHTANPDSRGRAQAGVALGGMLGLLGLLLGFSFAGAASRFIERRDLILEEANAIGTAYLRADLLNEPSRSALREQLSGYVAYRVEVSKTLRGPLPSEVQSRVAEFHDGIWHAAVQGVSQSPGAMLAVLNPVNDVIDLHAARVTAGRQQLPGLVLTQLIVCAVLALGTMGYGFGLEGRRWLVVTASFVILVGAALWTTIDLDNPRAGLIRLSDAPLVDLGLPVAPTQAPTSDAENSASMR